MQCVYVCVCVCVCVYARVHRLWDMCMWGMQNAKALSPFLVTKSLLRYHWGGKSVGEFLVPTSLCLSFLQFLI
jgi:hypothetical protein